MWNFSEGKEKLRWFQQYKLITLVMRLWHGCVYCWNTFGKVPKKYNTYCRNFNILFLMTYRQGFIFRIALFSFLAQTQLQFLKQFPFLIMSQYLHDRKSLARNHRLQYNKPYAPTLPFLSCLKSSRGAWTRSMLGSNFGSPMICRKIF